MITHSNSSLLGHRGLLTIVGGETGDESRESFESLRGCGKNEKGKIETHTSAFKIIDCNHDERNLHFSERNLFNVKIIFTNHHLILLLLSSLLLLL